MDFILACNAPHYGEIATLYEPLACYRIHDTNLYATRDINSSHFIRMANAFTSELEYFSQRCRDWNIPFDPAAACKCSVWLQECRLLTAKLPGDAPKESVFITLCDAIKAYHGTPMSPAYRMLRIVWLVSVAAAPRALASRLIALRFLPGQRSAWLEGLLTRAMKFGPKRKSPEAQTDFS
jgi:hypothetical protein